MEELETTDQRAPSGRGTVGDIQLALRVCESVGVGPADTSNDGQGEQRVGSDSLGYLRTTGTGHDFHNSSPAKHHLGLERGVRHHRSKIVPRRTSGETDCLG
jgi:hypothetical protein